jgi:(2Fe-2S) ferredoxin
MKPICLICQNVDCKLRGAGRLMTEINSRLAARSLEAEVRPYLCFGACEQGPHIVLYPHKQWYARVSMDDVPEIVDYLAGGRPVMRLDHIDRGLKKMLYDLLDLGLP